MLTKCSCTRQLCWSETQPQKTKSAKSRVQTSMKDIFGSQVQNSGADGCPCVNPLADD